MRRVVAVTLCLVAANVALWMFACQSCSLHAATQTPTEAQHRCPNPQVNATNATHYCIRHGDLSSMPVTRSQTLEWKTPVNYPEHRIRPHLFYRRAIGPFPDYMIALASPEQDPFSARYVHELNAHEWHVEEVYAQALAGVCSNTTRVLDCGANVGHTVALAAALGCHVTAYELQPRLHILTKLTAAANGWQDRVVLRSGVAPRPGTFGPFMYTPLGTSSGYPNVNMFPSTTGNCTQSDSPYCEKQVEIVNILEDFNTNIQFVKLDTDSNELELMLALIDKMNKTGLDIINFIVEGNMPVPMPTNSTPIYQLCVMGYHAFLLANPKLSPFYDPIASVMHRVKMKGYIEDAFYVKECTSLDTIIGHIRKWNGNFVGNWWLTKDKTQYAALVAPS